MGPLNIGLAPSGRTVELLLRLTLLGTSGNVIRGWQPYQVVGGLSSYQSRLWLGLGNLRIGYSSGLQQR
jgi:hypothetical protein